MRLQRRRCKQHGQRTSNSPGQIVTDLLENAPICRVTMSDSPGMASWRSRGTQSGILYPTQHERASHGEPDKERRYSACLSVIAKFRSAGSQGRLSEYGFTLIELLIVIVVLGILAAIVIFSLTRSDRSEQGGCVHLGREDGRDRGRRVPGREPAPGPRPTTCAGAARRPAYLHTRAGNDATATRSASTPAATSTVHAEAAARHDDFDDATGCTGASS